MFFLFSQKPFDSSHEVSRTTLGTRQTSGGGPCGIDRRVKGIHRAQMRRAIYSDVFFLNYVSKGAQPHGPKHQIIEALRFFQECRQRSATKLRHAEVRSSNYGLIQLRLTHYGFVRSL